MTPRPHIVIINASLGGTKGNTAIALERARRQLSRRASVTTLTLADSPDFASLDPFLVSADGFLFGTGTHWDSWSSLLQKFLEDATPSEGTKLWLGKPAAIVVTEHSVGAKDTLSRLQGILVTFGCLIPPMSGLVLSCAALLAAKHDPTAAADFWTAADLSVVCHNLAEAASGTAKWKSWSVERTGLHDRWLDDRTIF